MNTTQWLAHWRDQLRVKQAAGEYTDWLRYRLDEAETALANGTVITARELPLQRNGFIREGVLRRQLEREDETALAHCLVCLNDPVANLRELARAELERRQPNATAEGLLDNLDLLLDLQRKQRADHSVALERIRARLREPALRSNVRAALPGLRGQEARFVFDALANEEQPDAELIDKALVHPDPALRARVMDRLGHLPTESATPLWRQALSDRNGRLRARALYAVIKAEPNAPELHGWLETALLDVSPSVRDLARWAAPRHGVDAAAVVRRALVLDPVDRGRWHGVLGQAAELRLEEAVPLARQALASPLPSVRRRGLQVLVDRVPEQAGDACLALLDDRAPGVVVEALQGLERLCHPAFEPALRAAMTRLAATDMAGCLRLSRMLPAHAQLEALLEGLCEAPQASREPWLQALRVWRHRQKRLVNWTSTTHLKARLESLRGQQLMPEEELSALMRAL